MFKKSTYRSCIHAQLDRQIDFLHRLGPFVELFAPAAYLNEASRTNNPRDIAHSARCVGPAA